MPKTEVTTSGVDELPQERMDGTRPYTVVISLCTGRNYMLYPETRADALRRYTGLSGVSLAGRRIGDGGPHISMVSYFERYQDGDLESYLEEYSDGGIKHHLNSHTVRCVHETVEIHDDERETTS